MEPDWFARLTPPQASGFSCSQLSLHCSRACAAETRPAHPRSCSFRIRRAITAAFALPLLLPARLAKSVDASLSVASAAPRRALDVVKPWKETLDAMLFAGKLLPNPPLLFLCSLACASAVRTSAPRYSFSSSCVGPAFASALSRRTCAPLPCTPSQHPPDGVLHP
jgi:hypothetical protein